MPLDSPGPFWVSGSSVRNVRAAGGVEHTRPQCPTDPGCRKGNFEVTAPERTLRLNSPELQPLSQGVGAAVASGVGCASWSAETHRKFDACADIAGEPSLMASCR